MRKLVLFRDECSWNTAVLNNNQQTSQMKFGNLLRLFRLSFSKQRICDLWIEFAYNIFVTYSDVEGVFVLFEYCLNV